MWTSLRRRLDRARLRDPAFAFLFEPPPPDEAVALDCETTGLDPRRDEIVAVAAIRIRGDRILTSESLRATVRSDRPSSPEAIKVHRLLNAEIREAEPLDAVLPALLRFIGGRPIVGYYTEFDVRMLDKSVRRQLGIRLPNPRIDVSSLYHAAKYRDAPDYVKIDLSFARILEDLGLPALPQHDAFNDALMTAMIYLQLRDLLARRVAIRREAAGPVETVAFGA
ncbi:3'-5' exonuclease [Methylobacterium sp. WSM2598]|uniref:3'-5' exonuclease n=1 Tax=Methylobacterium sp. WSM2598 TaxID=398261 RepID=UPI0003705A31|nr:3'-5' exonuclease [Methylobacterium sp. WSM2598]